MFKLLCLFFFCLTPFIAYSQGNELNSIFLELDRTMANQNQYIQKKEQKIAELQSMFDVAQLSPEQ